MTDVYATDVLIVGAGPIGLTAALELRRRGVGVPRRRQADRAAAVRQGRRRAAADAGAVGGRGRAARRFWTPPSRSAGRSSIATGEQVAAMDLALPPDMAYGFAALPQYETERLLRERAGPARVRSRTQVSSWSRSTQDDAGVTASLVGPAATRPSGPATSWARDGAHSIVRKTLGLSFEGGAFPEEYMLGDVEVDWSLPAAATACARRTRPTDGSDRRSAGLHPAPGPQAATGCRCSCRRSCRRPHPPRARSRTASRQAELRSCTTSRPSSTGSRPEPTTARSLRWSSVFRISHRIAGRVLRPDGRSLRATPRTSTRRPAPRA